MILQALLAACFLYSAPAVAPNWVNLLKNTPAERFNDDDLRLFLDNARKALSEASDNQTLAWQNPQTGHGGDVTVLKTFEHNGRQCKEVRVRNQADGRKSTNTHNLCNVDGKWRMVSRSQLKKP